MSRTFDFLRECGTFFLLTMNGDSPAGRPFGAVMEYEGRLYISTGAMKQVYAQLKRDGHVQLLALKPGTRSWLRTTGIATECDDMEIRARMLDECPALKKHFPAPNAPYFAVFGIGITQEEIY